jgi:hypothetical protein
VVEGYIEEPQMNWAEAAVGENMAGFPCLLPNIFLHSIPGIFIVEELDY